MMHMKKQVLTVTVSILFSFIGICGAAEMPSVNAGNYNVVWETPSKRSNDSMPLAGHNLGVNVWVEGNDLLVLVGSPNCLDETGLQIKLGLIRITPDQPVFAKAFRQELRLARSEMAVSGQGAEGKPFAVTLWGEAGTPVIHAHMRSETPVGLTVAYETWSGYEAKTVDGGIQWAKQLAKENPRRLKDMKAQMVEEFAACVPDPLSGLIEGGRLDAMGLVPAHSATGKFNGLPTHVTAVKTAKPVKELDLTLTFRMEQDTSLSAWTSGLAQSAQEAVKDLPAARTAALKWWEAFWNRSHITIDRKAGEQPWQAARNYQLSRYMLAANPSGRMMTLFNGGNFTCSGNPDNRVWGGCHFMGQNQMLVYWPMMRAGDFDLLKVGCEVYRERTEVNRLRAKKFWNVDGVAYSEAFSVFGLDSIGITPDGRCKPKHLHYHYTSSMVFALMMLGHDAYTGMKTAGYPDAAYGIISYYDQYYQAKLKKETGTPLDANGKLVIYPSDACEPYHGCVNNIDVLAGLQALARDLLATPAGVLSSKQRHYVEGFVRRIPEFKVIEKDGRKLYAAADKDPEWIFRNENMDFPQMYICFPFSAVSLGRSDMEWVRNTWELGPVNAKVQHQNQCWYQNAINFARMGETERAADYTVKKLCFSGYRFPAFYVTQYISGGLFDHPPDTDHAGVAMTALQEMLMQTDGDRILLGPAWPAEWNVHFKLHAPKQTTVEGRVEDGKVVVERVIPEARQKDITIFPLKALPTPPVSERRPATERKP